MSLDVGYTGDDDGRSYETGRVNISNIQLTLVRVESSLSAIRQDISYMREAQMTRANDTERRFNDQEMRLRAIEAKRYIEPRSVTTVFAVIIPLCALAVSIIAIVTK